MYTELSSRGTRSRVNMGSHLSLGETPSLLLWLVTVRLVTRWRYCIMTPPKMLHTFRYHVSDVCLSEIQYSPSITYQVGDTSEGVMYHNRAVELLLEYGPDWRTDMLHELHDIHTSCSDMFRYPVFCRDGVFWSCKLLLGAVSQVII